MDMKIFDILYYNLQCKQIKQLKTSPIIIAIMLSDEVK